MLGDICKLRRHITYWCFRSSSAEPYSINTCKAPVRKNRFVFDLRVSVAATTAHLHSQGLGCNRLTVKLDLRVLRFTSKCSCLTCAFMIYEFSLNSLARYLTMSCLYAILCSPIGQKMRVIHCSGSIAGQCSSALCSSFGITLLEGKKPCSASYSRLATLDSRL